MRKIKGFTLIELMVVIAIIGMLVIVLWPIFANARKRARAAEAKVARQLQLKHGDAAEFVLDGRVYKAVITDIVPTSAKRPRVDRTLYLPVSFRKTSVILPQGGVPDAQDNNGGGLDDNS